jgi:hypothetical protein
VVVVVVVDVKGWCEAVCQLCSSAKKVSAASFDNVTSRRTVSITAMGVLVVLDVRRWCMSCSSARKISAVSSDMVPSRWVTLMLR